MKLRVEILLLYPIFFLALTGFSQEEIKDTIAGSDTVVREGKVLLIINAFDAMQGGGRKNKRQLFSSLTDSLSHQLAILVEERTKFRPVVIPDVQDIHVENKTLVFSMMKENNASMAIVIRSLNGFFKESGSTETTDQNGKPETETRYDLCVENRYELYAIDSVLKRSTIENCEFLTSRTTTGRFAIHFGPDIVGKKKHTYQVVANNAAAFITEVSQELSTHQ